MQIGYADDAGEKLFSFASLSAGNQLGTVLFDGRASNKAGGLGIPALGRRLLKLPDKSQREYDTKSY